jgi:hypothetical protein
MKTNNTWLYLSFILAFGCNVDNNNRSTGGAEFGGAGGTAGHAGEGGSGGQDVENAANGGAAPETQCERGLVVVLGDYESTNIAISKLDGTTKSGSFISSGATKPGLSLAISGDVEVPKAAPVSGRVVLLDRFGTNVVTWLDLETAEVKGQLAVGTGFESNPQDYIEYATDRAVISRFGSNSKPGAQDFDAGGDLLLIDTKTPKILGRIAMPEENSELLPRPSGMTTLDDTIVVTLGRLSSDFGSTGDGRFVGVSPKDKKVLWTVDLKGVKNCGRLAKSPSGKLGAMACSSQLDSITYLYQPSESDIVIFDLTVTPPKEIRRLGLGKAIDSGLQSTVEFASESKLFATAYGGNSVPGDRALSVDVETGDYDTLLESKAPYKFSGMHCAPGCGDICVLADMESGKLRRFSVSSKGKFTALEDVTVESKIGLPPRGIGAI